MDWNIAQGLIATVALLMSGCASYYTHYAVFPAENSAGEERQIKLTWQTANYPDWWFAADKSTPMTLETQCSSRTWRIVDRTHAGAAGQACAPGIRACGSGRDDRFATAGGDRFADRACLRINPADPDVLVADISSSFELLVSCRPLSVSHRAGEEIDNTDYLRASPVPYTVYSRKGPRGRLASKPPVLDDAICDEE